MYYSLPPPYFIYCHTRRNDFDIHDLMAFYQKINYELSPRVIYEHQVQLFFLVKDFEQFLSTSKIYKISYFYSI